MHWHRLLPDRTAFFTLQGSGKHLPLGVEPFHEISPVYPIQQAHFGPGIPLVNWMLQFEGLHWPTALSMFQLTEPE
jgi:hypothetical protein